MSKELKNIGFIGVGTMGKPMAENMIKAGFQLFLYDMYPEKAKELVPLGAKLMNSPAESASEADVVITMVNDAPNLEEVYFGEKGCAETAKKGCIFVDMSTIAPNSIRGFHKRLTGMGYDMLDAPVSGGKSGAEAATLTIMVGGSAAAFETCKSVFEAMGKTITHLGGPGAGQITKMGNQIMLGLNTLGVCEGLMLAFREGLDLEKYLQAVGVGAGQSAMLSIFGKPLSQRIFPGNFPIKLIQKDFRLIVQTLAEEDLALPGAALMQLLYNSVANTDPTIGHEGVLVALEKMNSFQIGKYEKK